MNKAILSIKLMLLGGVLFLFGCIFIEWNSAIPLLTIFAGLPLLLAGLLMGNKTRKEDEP
ncbi:hypothetical protein AALC17_10200 [Oscillospiraceae bacterium 38-13]